MPTGYLYELWDGRKVLGHYFTLNPIQGVHLIVYGLPQLLKQPYSKKAPEVKVRMITRTVSDNGVDVVLRRCLDVRRKSLRQIKILNNSPEA